jgi:hypothetical protein
MELVAVAQPFDEFAFYAVTGALERRDRGAQRGRDEGEGSPAHGAVRSLGKCPQDAIRARLGQRIAARGRGLERMQNRALLKRQFAFRHVLSPVVKIAKNRFSISHARKFAFARGVT